MFEVRFWVKEFSHSHSYLISAAEGIFADISFWTEFFAHICPNFLLGEIGQSFSAFTSNIDINQGFFQ